MSVYDPRSPQWCDWQHCTTHLAHWMRVKCEWPYCSCLRVGQKQQGYEEPSSAARDGTQEKK